VLRYLLFAFGAPDQVAWMLFAGIALHGICYDFFFVTGFMYADRIAPKNVKGQVQSMLVFFTQGVGMFIGFKVAGAKLAPVAESSGALGEAIAAGRPDEKVGFFEQFGQMFSVSMPESVDGEVLSEASNLWGDYWMLPAYMAAVIAVIFFLGFWDKSKEGEDE
ncbi:MFS transporter, partial [bacterium]|nr:MFS transporter [bacterium]